MANQTAQTRVDSRDTLSRVERIAKRAESDWRIDLQYGIGIAEYGPDDQTIWVKANWNDHSVYDQKSNSFRIPDGMTPNQASLPSRLASAFETYTDAEVLWLDEYDTCTECFALIRTAADSYGWRLYGIQTEYGPVCGNCVLADIDAYLDEYRNNFRKAFTLDGIREALEAIGWRQWIENPEDYYPGRYQSGWHPGQTDNPEEIAERAESDGYTEWVFVVPSVGQFDVDFQIWVNPEIRST